MKMMFLLIDYGEEFCRCRKQSWIQACALVTIKEPTDTGLLNRHATASYGRIRHNEPAPTLTSRCTIPACGSFIHPKENRGLSLREAAVLQTFPVNYQFYGNYGQTEA